MRRGKGLVLVVAVSVLTVEGARPAPGSEVSNEGKGSALEAKEEGEEDEDPGLLHSMFDFDSDSASAAMMMNDGTVDEGVQVPDDTPGDFDNPDWEDELGPDFSLVGGALPARSVASNSFVKAANRPDPHERKCTLRGLSDADACARMSTSPVCKRADRSRFLRWTACHPMKWFAISLLVTLALAMLYALVLVAERFYAYAVLSLTNKLHLGPELSAQILALANSVPNVFGIAASMSHGAKPDPSLATSAALGACIFVNGAVLGAVGLSSSLPVKLTRQNLIESGVYGVGLFFTLGAFLLGSISALSGFMMLVIWIAYFALLLQRDSSAIKEDKDTSVSFKLPTDDSHSDSAANEQVNFATKMKEMAQRWVQSQAKGGGTAPTVHKVLTPLRVPLMAILSLTMPDPSIKASKPYVVLVAVFGSAFSMLTSGAMPIIAAKLPFSPLFYIVALALLVAAFGVSTCPPGGLRANSIALSMLAFAQSVSWTHFAADMLVSVADVLARLAGASHAVLGATILGWGAGIVDLVANVFIARAGGSVIAACACFAGPAFTLLAGLGVTFAGNAHTHAMQVVASNGLFSLFSVAVITLALTTAVTQAGMNRVSAAALLGVYGLFATIFALSQAV